MTIIVLFIYTSQYTSITLSCIGFLLNSAWCLGQPHLLTSFSKQVFLGILLHIFVPTLVLTAPGAAKVVAISLSFQSSTLLFINLSSSLVIVLLLMLPLFGMHFQMRFVPLHPWPLSESSLKPTCTPKHTHLSLDHPLVFSMVLDPLLSLDTEIWSTALLVLLRLRAL